MFERNLFDIAGAFFSPNKQPALSSGKLRILIFNWRDTKHKWAGGAEVYIQELAKRWVKEGNQVTIFCGNDNLHTSTETVDGVNIIRRGGFYTVYAWAMLYYAFQFRGNFDVVVDCENGIPFFTPLYIRKPIFLLIHHVHQEVFRRSLAKPFSALAEFLELTCMPFIYRSVQVVTVSPSSKQEIMKHQLTKKEPVVIYNGVDLSAFKPGKKDKDPHIIYVGRLQQYKSLHVFIHAAKKILSKKRKVIFTIAGNGEEKYRLQKLTTSLGLDKKIQFLGKISHEEKIKLFQKAWIFVNPSLMEGWGITTIEANACATPAVASDVPGLRDSIKNSQTGLLATYGDIDDFVKKVVLLLDDEKLRKELSAESIKWAQTFSWDESAQRFYQLLENAVRIKAQSLELTYAQAQ